MRWHCAQQKVYDRDMRGRGEEAKWNAYCDLASDTDLDSGTLIPLLCQQSA